MNDLNEKDYEQTINKVPGLSGIVKKFFPKTDKQNHLLLMEFVLYGLTEYSLLSRFKMESGIQFKDMLSSMFTMSSEDDNDESDNDIERFSQH